MGTQVDARQALCLLPFMRWAWGEVADSIPGTGHTVLGFSCGRSNCWTLIMEFRPADPDRIRILYRYKSESQMRLEIFACKLGMDGEALLYADASPSDKAPVVLSRFDLSLAQDRAVLAEIRRLIALGRRPDQIIAGCVSYQQQGQTAQAERE